MNKAQVNGIEMAYRTAGSLSTDTPWIVFSHPLATDHTIWRSQIDAFSSSYRLLLPDTRGHGGSSAPAGEYSLELLADDLKALLESLKIRQCHFVGLSMGGMIGMHAALRDPRRFLSLTLADTTSRYPTDARPTWEARMAQVKARGTSDIVLSSMERWFTPAFRRSQPEIIAAVAQLIRMTPDAGYLGCAYAVSRMNLTARLEPIDCPTLVMVGDQDPSTPLSMAEEIVQAIRGSRLQVLSDAAHLAPLEQPHQFNQQLHRFFERIS